MTGTGTVTILFTDLADSTAQEASTGSAAWDHVRDEHFATLRDAVDQHGGTVVKTIGDALMATFTSAVDAVACSVAMQQGVAVDNRRGGRSLGLRVGISAGDAVRQDGDWFGLPVVEASRLCALARPGQIVVADIVRFLGRGRASDAFESLGSIDLKGIPEPIAASEVLWAEAAAAVPLPPRLAGAPRSALVGRVEQLEALRELWGADAGEDRASVVLLGGEPGIGKTRLAAELAQEVHASGATVLFGHCDEDLNVPYRPFVDALRHYASAVSADAVCSCLGSGAGDLARVLPELRDLVPGLSEPTRADFDTERFAMFEAVTDVFMAAAADAPVLVVLDDLHWADRQTLLLLRHLARALQHTRVLLLGTYRDTELGRKHPLAETLADLRRERLVERLALRGLQSDAIAEMARSWAGTDVPGAFAVAIHGETEGNPFFVEEVFAHLAETGAVETGAPQWTSSTPIADLGIPEGIREVVGRRLARLTEETVDVLSVASVIGREFSIDILERCDATPVDAVLDAVEAATRAGLVHEMPGSVGHFAFSHALVRQTLYEELSNVRRARLHWSVGVAAEDADPALAAFHLLEGVLAGEVGHAVRAAIRAAEAAAAELSFDEASVWYERAKAVLDQLKVEDPVLRYDVGQGRGDVENSGGRVDVARPHFFDAIEAARTLGDAERLVRAVEGHATFFRFQYDRELDELLTEAVGSMPPGADVLNLRLRALAATHHTLWFGRKAQEDTVAELVAAAEATDDQLLRASIYSTATMFYMGSPRSDLGLGLLEKLERYLDATMPWSWRQVTSLLRAAFSVALGDRDAFDDVMRDVASRLPSSGDAFLPLWIWTNAVAVTEGRFVDAKAGVAAVRAMPLAGQGSLEILCQGQLTTARIEQGRGPEIVESLAGVVDSIPALVGWQAMATALLAEAGDTERAQSRLDAIRDRGLVDDWNYGVTLRWLAEAAAHLEDVDAAQALEPEVTPYAGQLWVAGNLVTIDGAADRALGQLAMIQGRLDEAVGRLEAAAALERGFRAPALAVRSELWLGRALEARDGEGDRQRAEAVLRGVADEAGSLGMALVERQARELLAGVRG